MIYLLGEKTFLDIYYYSLFAELYNLYPKWHVQPLTSKSNKAAKTLQETSFTWGNLKSVHDTAADERLPLQHIQFPIYLLIFLHRILYTIFYIWLLCA